MDGLNKVIRTLNKVAVFSRWTKVVGIGFLCLMVLLNFTDVILRYIFNHPITGAKEITEVMMILAIFLSITHTLDQKGHITVDVITAKLGPKARIGLDFATNLLALGLFAIAVWRVTIQAIYFAQHNTSHSQYFMIPSAPFAAIIAFGCTTLWLLLLRNLLEDVVEGLRLGLKQYHWLLMLGIPILVIVLALLWMQPTLWQMNLTMVGLIGVIFSLLFFFSGMPISFALILVSFIFIGHIRGSFTALDMLGTDLYRTTGTYLWAVLPFFVIMGYFCFFARFGEDLYITAYRWLGHIRGGLAIATIGACTGFAAIVADSVSACATMASVALPEMNKYKYDTRLSTGVITSACSLGPIIPPSAAFIIYGLITSESIGKLFVAGIIPGLLIAAAMVFVTYFWCWRNPNVGPPGEKSGWIPRLVSLKGGGPVVALFLLVIGGIYAGIFTPTEGGAVGATGALLFGLIMRRFTWKTLTQSLIDSGRIISAVFLIFIGALMFTRFAEWCNVSSMVTGLVTGLGLSPNGFVLLVLLVLLILGCFIDMMPLLLIGVPIFYPVANSLGINPIWFAVLVVVVINLGGTTPPVGINLFTLKGIAKDIPMGTIYRGTFPFVLAYLLATVVVFVVPQCATWLPGILK